MPVVDPKHSPITVRQIVPALTGGKFGKMARREASCEVYEEGRGPRRLHAEAGLGAKLLASNCSSITLYVFSSKRSKETVNITIFLKIVYFLKIVVK